MLLKSVTNNTVFENESKRLILQDFFGYVQTLWSENEVSQKARM